MTTPKGLIQDVYATQDPATVQGHWVLMVHGAKKFPTDVTWFRGAPTKLNSWSFEDPFSAKALSVTFPAITIFDRLHEGELDWCTKDANIDLIWAGSLPTGYPYSSFRWEGYIESFSWGNDGLTVDAKGGLYQLDNYQAKPEYLSRPLSYEAAILRQFRDKPDLRFAPARIDYPWWWTKKYSVKAGTPSYLQPNGVTVGKNWTGLVTRSTGTWEPTLTSYIQTLLSSMYTERGRWTLSMLPGRVPAIQHRDYAYAVLNGHLVIDPADPGVSISLTQDFSQSLNRVFGQNKSLSGVTYSGMEVYPDGIDTYYLPLAQLRQVNDHHKSGWWDPSVMVREVLLQLQAGLEEDDAAGVATSHLQHFADPGLTGSITLKTDVNYVTATGSNDKYFVEALTTETMSRMLIREGMTLLIPGLFGKPEGVLFHIAKVDYSGDEQSVTLTVDTKYRDALTVSEVRERGRDSLSVQRQLIGGQYAPPVNDQLVPWNYSRGSGCIPSSPHLSAVPLFRSMPRDVDFPWTSWTTLHPPKNKEYANCYVHIGPKNSNANNNWAAFPDRNASYKAIPIKMAQAGTIRLIELAAYDRDGNIFPVPFHVSFYYAQGTTYKAMPMLRAADNPKNGYAVGQHYPFFDQAWEQYNIDGTKILTEQPTTVSSAGLIRAYGTGIVKAGYWPGSQATGDSPTGMLHDEGTWDWDCSQDEANVNVQQKHQKNPLAGYIYMMIYCDAQGTNDVYFAGRMYRVEPGSQ